ncbi:hypothetical protein WN55_04620 [Dufourea novaeangliae]|uniref:Uncharacterized protein n=1 Tax=Dufourea novaeangliae TaxID=178035 RepID=A0A154P3H0_DUFNO|nr:hypothetical protein WN55_04620 [Dufourea novaeangliae]
MWNRFNRSRCVEMIQRRDVGSWCAVVSMVKYKIGWLDVDNSGAVIVLLVVPEQSGSGGRRGTTKRWSKVVVGGEAGRWNTMVIR